MGIYGLSSYISNRATEFLNDFKLHNCLVLIDGNSAASLIYSTLTQSNHAFGGDYDKYARSTIEFIQLLKKCAVHPVFIFDGGYELKKLRTVIDRLKMNIVVCGQYKHKYRESRTFPLLLRDDFKTILRSQNVPVIQCDLEADYEIIILARIFKCPVISYDSDFYMSDALYIPFTSIEFKASRYKKKLSKHKYYISCKKFDIDKFLNHAGGVFDKALLPLLSCALGNDYIPPNTFKNFLNMNYLVKFNERIQKIVKWMKEITCTEDAIEQMMVGVEKNQNAIKNTINQMLVEYNRNSSELLHYIGEEFKANEKLSDWFQNLSLHDHVSKSDGDNINCDIAFMDSSISNSTFQDASIDLKCYLSDDDDNVNNEDGIVVLDVQEYEIAGGSDHDSESNEDEAESDVIENKTQEFENSNNIEILDDYKLPEWFLKKYRCGLITPNLINVINFQRIFIPSQSENYFSSPSHEICLPILQLIVGIVLGERPYIEKVKCHARIKNMQIGVYEIVPKYESPDLGRLPTLKSVESLDDQFRATILLKCLNQPEDTNLNLFPEEWKLFMIILLYWKKNCKHAKIDGSHIRTIIVCLIYLTIVDNKIGFVRSSTDLRKYRREILKDKCKTQNENENCAEETNDETVPNNDCAAAGHTVELNVFADGKENLTLADYINFVSEEDCFKFADATLQYHQINPNLLKNRKDFNLKLVHTFAQLQHCIQSITTLNAVLNFPFSPCQPHLVFSGTFLYNFYSELDNRKLADGYITRTLLAKTDTIISVYRYLIASWEMISMKKILRPKLEKKKKKSKNKTLDINKTDQDEGPNTDAYYDPNNIYSMLPVE